MELSKARRGNNTSFVSKRPVGFQDELLKKVAASAPQFNKQKPNCLPFEQLFDPELGSVWSPFKFYEDLRLRKITFEGTDIANAEGLHH
jgi:hypothetical protein